MKKQLFRGQWLMLLMIGLMFVTSADAQNNEPGPITHTYALKNVNIITRPGQLITNGTVVIRNGLIHAVGQNVSIPGNAKVLEADSMYVYAAFIDGASHTAIPKPKEEANQGRGSRNSGVDPSNPGNVRAGITPDIDVQDKLDHKDKSITDLRKVGFGAVHAVPIGRMLPGTGAVILLAGESNDDMVMKANTSAFAQLKGAGGVMPATVIAVMSKFRDLYRQAEQAKAHIAKYKSSPSGLVRPAYDDATMAMIPVVEKTKPVYFMADDHLSISRVFQLQKDLGFKLVLVGPKKGWHHINTIKSKNIPVYLSMDLPKKPEEKKDAKKGDKKKEEKKKEMTEFDKEKEALQARKDKEYAEYVAQAATFSKAGVNFGFSTEGAKAKDIHGNVRRMVEGGLSESAALTALTTYPAQQLGVSQQLGTVEKGKVANLMVTKKPYFDEKMKVAFMVVDGQVFEYDVKEKKKTGNKDGDKSMAAKMAGEWTYELSIPGESQTGTITIVNEDGELSGTMISDQDEDQEVTDLDNISLDGDKLSFDIEVNDGQMIASFDLTVDENTFEGTVSVGEFGSFPVKGEKSPE